MAAVLRRPGRPRVQARHRRIGGGDADRRRSPRRSSLGTTRWAAVVVAPMAVGFAFMFGFVGNVLGLALFLAVLPRLDRFVRAPTAKAGGDGVRGAGGALRGARDRPRLACGCIAIAVLAIAQPLRVQARPRSGWRRWGWRSFPASWWSIKVDRSVIAAPSLLDAPRRHRHRRLAEARASSLEAILRIVATVT